MSDESRASADWIRAVLEEHEAPLLRYALRLTGDVERARDVVQETFLRLCRAEPATVDGHLGPWLFRVCRQRAIDQRRKEQRMPATVSQTLHECVSTEPNPSLRLEQLDENHALLRVLATLPMNQQEVVRLKFQAGLSYREITYITGLSVSNVGFLLHTALARLREHVTIDEATTPGEMPAAEQDKDPSNGTDNNIGDANNRVSDPNRVSGPTCLGGPDNLLSGRR